ncbi:MAG: hypothetical protein IPK79_02595 [Vampirovibrionales bacterium]|nr:hypothetical protein [Vampirovibrionales bacterium]
MHARFSSHAQLLAFPIDHYQGKLATSELRAFHIPDLGDRDPDNLNVDVTVELSRGRPYIATFFTVQNAQELIRLDHPALGKPALPPEGLRAVESGQKVYGINSRDKNVFIQEITPDNVKRAIYQIIQDGLFFQAFEPCALG